MTSASIPINFTLNIVNGVVATGFPTFTVPTTAGKTLFQALPTFMEGSTNFSFRTKNAPNVGHYIMEVMGEKNQRTQFWEVLLSRPSEGIIPIRIGCFIPSANDEIILSYKT